ncbi:hypothetical protein EPN87_04230 [archaeon]|nr:MAG: hypothetical protein EPN87_04230 [archaeon]
MVNRSDLLLALIVIGIVFISGCAGQPSPFGNDSNMGQNNDTEWNRTHWQGNNNDFGPTIGRTDTGGYPLFPLNTCPDKILSQNASQPKTILLGTLNGTTYAMQGEDWIRANCDPGLWIFEEARNMTKEDYLKLLPSCGSNYTLFSVVPVDMNKVAAIVPLGNFNPQGGHVYPTDHVYFSSGGATWNPTTLYAPDNGWIMEIRVDTRETGTEYIMDFAPCREVIVRFDHVKSISQKLADKLVEPYDKTDHFIIGGTTRDVKTKLMNVSVSANEVLGVAGGGDWSTFDKRNTNVFANLTRYIQYDYSNATCPIDYYTADVKASLQAKLGKYDGSVKRTLAPVCGQVAQDVPNTAQGIWVKVGGEAFADVNQESYQLTLAHDNIDPSTGVFVMGPSVTDVVASIYTFAPTSSGLVNRDFKDVKSDGNVYCYDVTTIYHDTTVNSFILQLTSPTTLRIARHYSSCGSGPWTFSQYTDFER